MERVDIIAFLQMNELTKNLSLEELEKLIPFIAVDEFDKNEMVFREGDASRELYLVVKGRLAVLMTVEDQVQQFGVIEEGQFFGEMAHLENERRSASVQALEPVVAISIHLDKLQKAEDKRAIYSKIVTQLARKVSGNLRKTDHSLIDSLKEKLCILQTHKNISDILIHFIVLTAIWFNFYDLLNWFPSYKSSLDEVVTVVLFIAFGLSSLYMVKTSGYPFSFFGLTFENWFRVSVEAVLYSLPIMIFFAVLKWVLIHNVGIFQSQPLIVSAAGLKQVSGLIALYIVFTPVQEFVARGVLQSCFRNFFQGPNRVIAAVVVSNLLFQVLHTTKDPWIAIASLFCGFFWGILFEVQKSLVGVVISHAIVGAWAFFILDFDTLIQLFNATRGL